MKLKSYLIQLVSGEFDITAVAVLPADVVPNNTVLLEECKKTLPCALYEKDYDMIPKLLRPSSLKWWGEDVDCPPGCDSTHVKCYPEYRVEFDKIAPKFPDLWSAAENIEIKEYPFGF